MEAKETQRRRPTEVQSDGRAVIRGPNSLGIWVGFEAGW